MRLFAPLRWLACMFALVTTLGFAADATVIHFDIPAGTAATAVKVFARQSGSEVIIRSDKDGLVKTNAVKGDFTAAAALDAMLKDTGLVADRHTKTGAFAIRSETEAESKNVSRAIVETDARPSGKIETDSNGEKILKLDTFEVFGRKTLNMDIRRTRDDIQPYVIFDAEVIQQSGAENLDEFLKNRLPMNSVQANQVQNPSFIGGNLSSVALRGLDANQTLVLVDGRRLPSVNFPSATAPALPDINGVPLSSIERIEILPSSASGIYGGGATGGVINIITKKNYKGAEINISYGNTSRFDAQSFRADVSTGLSFNEGRSRLFFAASRSDSDRLRLGDRGILAKSRALQLANNPSAFFDTFGLPQSRLTNIASANGTNLVLDDGTQLNSPYTYVPSGYSGRDSDNGASLVPNAGKLNFELPYNALEADYLAAVRLASANINFRQEIGASFEFYADVAWTENESRINEVSAFNATVNSLAASAPNNPFTTAIRVVAPSIGPVRQSRQISTNYSVATGLIVKLPRGWQAVGDYSWSRSRWEAYGNSASIGDVDGAGGPAISPATAFSSGLLNSVRDLNIYPVDFSPYLLRNPSVHFGPSESEQSDKSMRISGPVFNSAAGEWMISGLLEHRTETQRPFFIENVSAARPTGYGATYFTRRETAVSSYYAETSVPLFGAKSRQPLLHELSLQASVRRDEYESTARTPSTVGNLASREAALPAFQEATNHTTATKATYGIKLAPLESLAFRASFASGFLPPSPQQIAPSIPLTQTISVADPKRGNVATTISVPTNVGGNPGLLAESSESLSIGTVLQPSGLPGFRVSVDFTQIKKKNEFYVAGPAEILAFEDYFPSAVTRAPLTPAETAQGYTGGAITAINNSLVNISASKLRAVDFQVNYDRDFGSPGHLALYAIATYQPLLERQATPAAPFINQAGFIVGPLTWRGNGGVTWTGKHWTAGWNVQFYDSYHSYFAQPPGTNIQQLTVNQGSDRIASQTYHDVFLKYRLPHQLRIAGIQMPDWEISLTLRNVLDRVPPIIATTGTSGGYSMYGDPRLSRFQLSFKTRF